ncbi:MAG: hypothetical protein ACREBB_05655 [Nitrosotalea sp.]
MKIRSFLPISIAASIIIIGTFATIPNVFATSWYVGQGLKVGDYYRYNISDIFYHNLAPFEFDMWIQNETSDGAYYAQVAVQDGSIVEKGTMKLGSVSPDPVYTDPNIAPYANVYHLTLTWLDSFAVKTHPVDILAPVWGQTGIYGEVSIGSIGMQNVTVPAGNFSASTLQFHDSGVNSYLWVDPSFAFPVKATVYAIKTSGSPSIGYEYNMLESGNSATPPAFLNVKSTNPLGGSANCPPVDYANDVVHNTQATDTSSVAIEYYYSPAVPHQGCPMGWRITFDPVFSSLAVEQIPDIHYDIFAVDNQGHELSSQAQSIGRQDLYVAVGNDEEDFLVDQPPPIAHYVIAVIGTGPQSGVTDTTDAGIVDVDVKVAPPFGSNSSGTTGATTSGLMNMNNTISTTTNTTTTQTTAIPAWIKNNAKWWSQGQIGDDQFVQGIQYLIQQGIMKIPVQSGAATTSGTQPIPSWIKNNAGWWASGQISDDQFVQGIQYMITNGIIKINS